MRRGRTRLVLVAVVLAGLGVGLSRATGGDPYELQVVMPSAAGLADGSRVQIKGLTVGKVTGLTARTGKAIVTVRLSGRDVPLHSGTSARISWDSLIGARYLELLPAPSTNPPLASGNMIETQYERVELDQLLATLDPDTRAKLTSLVTRLQSTLGGHETDLNATLQDAGPAFDELAQVLKAVGSDGPAIQDLVGRLRKVVTTLDSRQDKLSGTVHDLDQVTATTAAQQERLREGLAQLPPTLTTARTTLDKVPPAVDATVPLLTDLGPAAQRLPSVAHNLSPLLTDLRPTVADLRPTLVAAQALLAGTPALLDSAHAVVPPLTQALHNVSPAVAFLRPYTPDLVSLLSEWGSFFADYDAEGHYAHALINVSGALVDDNPGIMPPGLENIAEPKPGWAADQPWTDANGSGMR